MQAWVVVASRASLERIEKPTPEPTGNNTGSIADLRDVARLAESGKLAALPVTLMPKDEANPAMNRLRDGKVTGRIILVSEPT